MISMTHVWCHVISTLANVVLIVAIVSYSLGCDSNGGVASPPDELLIAAIELPDSDVVVYRTDEVTFGGKATGGTPPYNYEWDFGDPALGPSTQRVPGSRAFLTDGEWTVRFTATDQKKRQGVDSLKVTVNTPPYFTKGNLVICGDNTLFEYTKTGTLIQTVPLDYGGAPYPITENARDVVYLANGDAAVYNGTFSPFLSVYSPVTRSWSHYTCAGWSTVANTTYGGIAVHQNFIFATDMATAGAAPKGIVRFDINGGYECSRWDDDIYGSSWSYIDVAVGLDGWVYSLSSGGRSINVLDPVGFTYDRTIVTGVPLSNLRAIAVNASGDIFGAGYDGTIYHFDSTGAMQKSLLLGSNPGAINLNDIDVAEDGTLVVSSGRIHVTDEDFTAPSVFRTEATKRRAFVTFVTTSPAY